MKHCLLVHGDEDPENVKFGMRIRRQYRTPIERQIGEATSILMDQRNEKVTLLNSKSEFNRCSLPRVTAGSHKELLDTLIEEDETEKKVKADIRCMRKRKKKEKEEIKEGRKEELLKLCEEIIAENTQEWKRRKLDEEGKRKLREEKEKSEMEKKTRLEKAAKKKKELLEKIEKKNGGNIVIIKKGKGLQWIREKQKKWREYREREQITDEDEVEMRRKLLEKIPTREKKMSAESEPFQNPTLSPVPKLLPADPSEQKCSDGGLVGRAVAGLKDVWEKPAKVTKILASPKMDLKVKKQEKLDQKRM